MSSYLRIFRDDPGDSEGGQGDLTLGRFSSIGD